MPGNEIRVSPSRLREIADILDSRAQRVERDVSQTAGFINGLIVRGVFRGQRAQALYTRHQHTYRNIMQFWDDHLRKFAQMLREAADAFESADGRSGGSGGGRKSSGHTGLDQYVRGDGWNLVTTGGFNVNELLTQIGGSCTIYGIMNLLIEEGIDISQGEANAILHEMTQRYDRNHSFPWEAAQIILKRYGVTYTANHIGFNRDMGERVLLENLSQGNPIYVWTQVDDSFGLGNSGHAYTVVGTQTGPDGKLKNVLVSTNWGGNSKLKTIPINAFMDDWTKFNRGFYVTVP